MHILCAISALAAPVCGYGSRSDKGTASYVSPYAYVPLSCVQLADAAISVRTAQTGGTQNQKWTRDATIADVVISGRRSSWLEGMTRLPPNSRG